MKYKNKISKISLISIISITLLFTICQLLNSKNETKVYKTTLEMQSKASGCTDDKCLKNLLNLKFDKNEIQLSVDIEQKYIDYYVNYHYAPEEYDELIFENKEDTTYYYKYYVYGNDSENVISQSKTISFILKESNPMKRKMSLELITKYKESYPDTYNLGVTSIYDYYFNHSKENPYDVLLSEMESRIAKWYGSTWPEALKYKSDYSNEDYMTFTPMIFISYDNIYYAVMDDANYSTIPIINIPYKYRTEEEIKNYAEEYLKHWLIYGYPYDEPYTFEYSGQYEDEIYNKFSITGDILGVYKFKDEVADLRIILERERKPLTNLELFGEIDEILVGETFQLHTIITPSDAIYEEITYTSSDPNIATFTSDGTITALKPGKVRVSVSNNDLIAYKDIEIVNKTQKELDFLLANCIYQIEENNYSKKIVNEEYAKILITSEIKRFSDSKNVEIKVAPTDKENIFEISLSKKDKEGIKYTRSDYVEFKYTTEENNEIITEIKNKIETELKEGIQLPFSESFTKNYFYTSTTMKIMENYMTDGIEYEYVASVNEWVDENLVYYEEYLLHLKSGNLIYDTIKVKTKTVNEIVVNYHNRTKEQIINAGLEHINNHIHIDVSKEIKDIGKEYYEVTIDNVTRNMYIKVEEKPLTDIKITYKPQIIEIGKKYNINYEITPYDAIYEIINWTTSDETIATIDEKGQVTPLKPGTITITAQHKNLVDSFETKIVYNIKNEDITVQYEEEIEYEGIENKSKVIVKHKEKILEENTDYKIEYSNNINVGTAKIKITGINNYEGTIEKEYKITPKDIKDITIEYNKEDEIYTGTEIIKEITLNNGKTKLQENTDYKIEYSNNINVGTAKIKITGINNYEGTIEKEYKITPKDIKDITIEYNKEDEIYTGTEIIKEISLNNGKTKLQENTDYKIEYSNNINVGTAKIKITGINNYEGTIEKEYKITPKDIKDITIEYNKEDEIYTGTEIIKEISLNNGKTKLQENTDYKIEYSNNINVGTAKIKITGINNYEGTIEKEYKITPKDIKDITIEYNKEDEIYTGTEIIKEISLNNGKTKLQENTDYKIEYSNNINVGTAKIKIIGIGNYNNTKELNFKILNADIDYTSIDYVGVYDDKEHSITIKNNKPSKVTIKYANEKGEYILDKAPVYKNVGTYEILYEISANNYNKIKSSNKVTIYGIKEIKSNIQITDKLLKIKNFMNDFKKLQDEFKIFANNYGFKHLNNKQQELNENLIKTGDYIQILIDNKKSYEYTIINAGDVNGDGKISALDYVKIKNHIMKDEEITSNIYMSAADANNDEKISALDYVKIKNYIMGGN